MYAHFPLLDISCYGAWGRDRSFAQRRIRFAFKQAQATTDAGATQAQLAKGAEELVALKRQVLAHHRTRWSHA